MKKIFVLTAVLTLFFSSCRKEADALMYYGEVGKMAYATYADQFNHIWRNISTGYVFWDIDTTDWDRVYDEFMPQFEKLDNEVASGKSVPDSVLLKIYKSAMGGMKDHHMKIYVKNLHPIPGNNGYIQVLPGIIAMEKRPEYIESRADASSHMLAFQNDIVKEFQESGDIRIIEHEQATFDVEQDGVIISYGVNYSFNLFQLADGRLVPYFWQNKAVMTPVFAHYGENSECGKGASMLDHYFSLISTTPKDRLAGFILDNRTNSGGYQDDLDYLIGSYINQEVVMFKTRYKEGPGRLEYSVWTDYKQKPFERYQRDITKDDIPYMILTDLCSISMGEIEPISARNVLPTTYVIGERSYGATGPLQADYIDLNYGGSFGHSDLSTGHYVYTSDFEAEVNGTIYEGTGIEPDLKVIRKEHGGSYKAAIDAALRYAADN